MRGSVSAASIRCTSSTGIIRSARRFSYAGGASSDAGLDDSVQPVAEGEQALGPGQDSSAGDGSQLEVEQMAGEALQIGESYAGEGLFGSNLEVIPNQAYSNSVCADLGTFPAKVRRFSHRQLSAWLAEYQLRYWTTMCG